MIEWSNKNKFVPFGVYHVHDSINRFAEFESCVFCRCVQFTTFRYADEIPEMFIKRHLKLRGCVKQVDDSAVLHVQHIPIVELLERKSNGQFVDYDIKNLKI